MPSVHVFVLGALSRSPRILMHAKLLAQNGWSVALSGYVDSNDQSFAEGLRVLPLPYCPEFRRFPRAIALLLKLFVLSVVFSWHLIRHCRSDVVLLQNPPAVPTFIILYIFTLITGKRLIIDWHNYGYTLLELATRSRSFSSRIYRFLELGFAGYAFANRKSVKHICVSKALRDDLKNHGLNATVFYDRAPEHFQRSSPEAAHELFSRLRTRYPNFADFAGSMRRTRFTEVTALPATHGGCSPQWRRDRPALVVSSCSWTADDDFDLILQALAMYDKKATIPDAMLPRLVLVVTGRGPLKSHYTRMIRNLHWTHVEVLTPWLEWSDYPVLLGCADLAICVHRSSSGLDLPMKVVDFLGVDVPVLALHYHTLDELLPDGRWGNHFTDSAQLTAFLTSLLRTECKLDAPAIGSEKLTAYRDALQKHNKETVKLESNWKEVVLPLFEPES